MAIGPYSRAGLAMVFVPLYAGPILAGLSGHPLATIPIFAVLFFGFMAMTRKPDLHAASGWITLIGLAFVQLVLATCALGAGLGFASVIGALTLPLWLPIAISAVAAGYGAWSYSDSAEMDVFLDGAIEKLGHLNHDLAMDYPAEMPMPSEAAQNAVDRAISDLLALPRDASSGVIDPVVQRLETAVGISAFDPLYDAAGELDEREDRRIDLALLRFVASPRMRRKLVERGEGGLGPMLLINARDPGVRYEARSLLLTLIDEGAPRSQLPDPVWLTELDTLFPGEGYDTLAAHRRSTAS